MTKEDPAGRGAQRHTNAGHPPHERRGTSSDAHRGTRALVVDDSTAHVVQRRSPIPPTDRGNTRERTRSLISSVGASDAAAFVPSSSFHFLVALSNTNTVPSAVTYRLAAPPPPRLPLPVALVFDSLAAAWPAALSSPPPPPVVFDSTCLLYTSPSPRDRG